MASPQSWSRRRFVASSAGTFGSGWLALNWSGITLAARHAHGVTTSDGTVDSFERLTREQARDVEALAAQIIPTTATAGAREAGVVHFIDRALGTFFAGHATEFTTGLAEFAARVEALHGGAARFANLTADTQLDVMQTAADTPFFEAVRMLTILGFLASPAYGGNRDRLGWQAVGFTDEHMFAPPFGHYDRDYPGFLPYPSREQDEPA